MMSTSLVETCDPVCGNSAELLVLDVFNILNNRPVSSSSVLLRKTL